MSDDATIFIRGWRRDEKCSRVIKERETFDSAYPNVKGYDHSIERPVFIPGKYTISLSKGRHIIFPFFFLLLLLARNREKDRVILDINRINSTVYVIRRWR